MPVNVSQGDNPFRGDGIAANNHTNSRHQLLVKEKKSGHGVCRWPIIGQESQGRESYTQLTFSRDEAPGWITRIEHHFVFIMFHI